MIRKAVDWRTVRQWTVKFEVHQPMKHLPYPDIVVEEVQQTPEYLVDGRLRKIGGGQLSITIGGRGKLKAAGKVYDLLPGTAFLHNHFDPEVCYYYPEDFSGDWRFLWMAFCNAEDIVESVNKRYGYVFNLPLDRGVAKLLASYRGYRGAMQVLTPLSGCRLIMDVITGLGDSFEKKLIENPQSVLVADSQRYVLENIGRDIGVDDIAAEFKVSREHLSRVFRDQTGVSPREYIARIKMRLACDLLLQTSLNCKEIAERVGYHDHSSFSRAFKNLLGTSPRMLRENGYRPDV